MTKSHDISNTGVLNQMCAEFESAWSANSKSDFKSYLDRVDQSQRAKLLRMLLAIEAELRIKAGQPIEPDDYRHLGDDTVGVIQRLLTKECETLTRLLDKEATDPIPADSACDSAQTFELSAATVATPPVQEIEAYRAKKIGRYRIERLLGHGGFGLVYLAFDEKLERHVAIKVPHSSLVESPSDAEAYLTEARTVANLDHPNIVPVHDVGHTDEIPCYVVSKYIEGTDLSKLIKRGRLPYDDAANLVMTVADALHYAHKQGLVHRDIKPGNILIDGDGKPHIVDFGLALRDAEIGSGPDYAGTPAYMSPEQARCEGHRVDGRSDIFSLGSVLYELLTGRRTFNGQTQLQLIDQIIRQEVKPPRQIDDSIPKELERICLKALSKRARDRYTTALDLAEDLRLFLAQLSDGSTATPATTVIDVRNQFATDSALSDLGSENQSLRVVPKGLRSFDENDADFFLALLPGPRDRYGLPDSIRFWKTRIEEFDSDKTFSVGLIYGPSGCGKSSLVKAGLLPVLSDKVIDIYVEAAPDDTEIRLLRGLRKHCPDLDGNLSLKDALAALRRGRGIADEKKVLIVLDQFEQWLHGQREEKNSELVEALRQCDGGRLQCVVMVRDDFWMAATRFMRALEIRLVEAENSAAVDLFSARHAEKVLGAFGRAFGALPEKLSEMSSEQKEFVKQSVAGLAEEGKIICVRLALFAEMMKGKAWTPSALIEMGGTEGVGVTFLEETFSASTAPPEHRYHQKAARAVLGSLLPESGADIKGGRKAYDELLIASGYANRQNDFAVLIKILDSELRLITPSDPEGASDLTIADHTLSSETPATGHPQPASRYYQLTHDYLIHSLREWLTRKQRETRRGRAELLLSERATQWKTKPENRHLPSLLEWINIRFFTRSGGWTAAQQQMMRRARNVHGIKWLAIGLLMTALVWLQWDRWNRRWEVESVVLSLQDSEGPRLRGLIERLSELPPAIVKMQLQEQFDQATERQQISLALALAEHDDLRLNFLLDTVPAAPTTQVDNLVAAFAKNRSESLESIRQRAINCDADRRWEDKTRFSILALHLNDESLVSEMLQSFPLPVTREDSPSHSDPAEWNPIQRTVFISEFPKWCGDVAALAETLRHSDDSSVRSGISLALGGIADPVPEVKQAWKSTLQQWFTESPDSGTHGASKWTLTQWWGDAWPKTEESDAPSSDRDWWHLNGLTLIKIPKGDVSINDRKIENQNDFWISDCEITIGQFKEFVKEAATELRPRDWKAYDFGGRVDDSHPAQEISVDNAALFCNWLSRRHGFTPCYQLNPTDRTSPVNNLGVTMIPDANGFRLPTHTEWEYACRTMTTTNQPFGYHEEYSPGKYLAEYAVMSRPNEGTEPAASKRCNAWGLFDMQGNVWEWCWSGEGTKPRFYGGSFYYIDANLFEPSSTRGDRNLDFQTNAIGFRIVKPASDH